MISTRGGESKDGDDNNSLLPFNFNSVTGETGKLKSNSINGQDDQLSSYTTNWSGTMELFLILTELKGSEGWSRKSLAQGGVITIRHMTGNRILVLAD